MSTLEYALRLAEKGFRILPCVENQKRAALKSWQVEATTDPAKLHEWFATGNRNLGVYAGERIDDGNATHMVVLDLDVKDGKDGVAELERLAEPHGGMPPTYAVGTPKKGQHIYLRTTKPVGNSVGRLASGIDVRGVNGYVVGPGSSILEGEYTVLANEQIADCPDWLEALLSRPSTGTHSANREPKVGVDPTRSMARAIEYLATAPEAVQGAGGDQTTFIVAARLKDLGLTQAAAAGLMLSEHWFDGCGWTGEELTVKVANAWRYGANEPGAGAAEAVFDKVDVAAQEKTAKADAAVIPAWVKEMNDRYFVVNEAGKPVVMRCVQDAVFNRRHFERSTFDDLGKLYLNRKVPSKKTNLAKAWLSHKDRRDYIGGLVFAPGKDVAEDQFNLWQGFGVAPVAGDWSLLRDHTLNVVCQGNVVVFEYLINWMARAVQEPSKQGETAIVMQSGEGTGKGVLARAMVTIFGQHGMQLMQAKHVTSNFNAHMRDLCFLFGDEAFFAADPSHSGVLKGLITEPTLTIEGKFQNAVTVPNMLHIMLASNEKWVVPAGKDDRRYLVLEVSETRKNEPEYFIPLYEQLNAGGYAAMLHELLARDISGFNVRRVPSTKAHVEQKRMTLRGVDRWLDECLQVQRMGGQEWTGEGLVIPTQQAYENYVQHHTRQNKFPDAIGQWARVLEKTLGAGLMSRSRVRTGSERVYCTKFASLSDCRRAFENSLGTNSAEWMDSATDTNEPAGDIYS